MLVAERITRARELLAKLSREAEAAGYHLNPDRETTLYLCEGLVANRDLYGYFGCPCRLLEGDKNSDQDIICPCDYRDLDLAEYGVCYCALYVTQEVMNGKVEIRPILERRPHPEESLAPANGRRTDANGTIHTWRCRVCGYLCARAVPPEECPVCHAKKDRFEIHQPQACP